MAIGKFLYGKTFSNTLFLHHLVVLIIYSIGLYYNGGMHYISMLVFVGEKPDPISYMMGKAKLTHLFIWNITKVLPSTCGTHNQLIVELYIFYTMFTNWDGIVKEVPAPFLVTFFFLTLYWTRLDAKRLFRVINKDKTS